MQELPIESRGTGTDNAPMNNTQNTPPVAPVRFYVKSPVRDAVWTFTVGATSEREARVYYADVQHVTFANTYCTREA